jgi:hypothetical protein
MNNVFILSYKKLVNGDKQWNSLLDISRKRFTNKGFNAIPVEGYNLKQPKPNDPKIGKTQLVYLNFLDKVLPAVKEQIKNGTVKGGFFFAEDDAFLDDRVDYDFLMKRIGPNKKRIVRVGYQKVLGMNTSGYFVVGNQLIWFPISKISKLESLLNSTTPQHLNGFFSKREAQLDIMLLDQEVQKREGKYVHEIEHVSITEGKVRPGLKLPKSRKKSRLGSNNKSNKNNKN